MKNLLITLATVGGLSASLATSGVAADSYRANSHNSHTAYGYGHQTSHDARNYGHVYGSAGHSYQHGYVRQSYPGSRHTTYGHGGIQISTPHFGIRIGH